MGLIGKIKGKLQHKEKQVEKVAQNKAPRDVDNIKPPDIPVTDTRPAEPDKGPQTGPPKPVLQAPAQPDAPHGTQKPDLSALLTLASASHLPPFTERLAVPFAVLSRKHRACFA